MALKIKISNTRNKQNKMSKKVECIKNMKRRLIEMYKELEGMANTQPRAASPPHLRPRNAFMNMTAILDNNCNEGLSGQRLEASLHKNFTFRTPDFFLDK
jgi:hypothetical protein